MAAMDGAVRFRDGEFTVTKLMKTGSLSGHDDSVNFDGSVWIKGDAEEGVTIRATGDVLVDGIISGATIRSGGDVLIRDGATGSSDDRSYIDADGSVSGRRFEMTNITCQGNLFSNSLLGCNIYSGQHVTLFGERGTASGGVVRARLGAELAVLGNKSVVRTVVEIGVNSETNDKYSEIVRSIARSQEEMKLLMEQRQNFMNVQDASNKQLLQLKIKINAGIATKEKELSELAEEKKKMEEEARKVASARLVVSRFIFANSAVQINGAATVIHDNLQADGADIVFEKSGKTIAQTGGAIAS